MSLLPIQRIQKRICFIRDHKVMLDSDLAKLYGVKTTRLNQQVSRNRHRFPADFMFVLTPTEKAELVANCNNLQSLKYYPGLPKVFTEHGAVMLASILNSHRAVEMSLFVVRAFVKVGEMLAAHHELARKLEALEKKYDEKFKVVFDAIRALMGRPAAAPKMHRLPSIPKVKGFSLRKG